MYACYIQNKTKVHAFSLYVTHGYKSVTPGGAPVGTRGFKVTADMQDFIVEFF